MASDPLYEILLPYLDARLPRPLPPSKSPVTAAYLNRLCTLPLASLNTTEPQSIAQTSHSLLLSLQALSSRSHKSVIASADSLTTLRTNLPALANDSAALKDSIPKLDHEALLFSQTYHKNAANPILDRRRQALLLARNLDRLADILDLPTLVTSAISSSSSSSAVPAAASTTLNYASALDLNAHIRRLHALYPSSRLIASVAAQADTAMQDMATQLIASLKIQGLKLAAAMRTISWLRRVAPDLTDACALPSRDAGLGALFLVCRLANLTAMLHALEPLRALADQESARRRGGAVDGNSAWSGGQQSERFLKRYVEIFREQSFAIVSMYKSIFPPPTELDDGNRASTGKDGGDPLLPLPSPLATFPLHLIDMLRRTLRRYLPNVRDRASRDSLLTQVLYCAASLGRLGGDFSMVLAMLADGEEGGVDEEEEGVEEGKSEKGGERKERDDESEEWVEVIRKHKVLAGRLETMVGAKE